MAVLQKKSMGDLCYKEELAKASEKKDDPLLKVTTLLDEMLRNSNASELIALDKATRRLKPLEDRFRPRGRYRSDRR